MQEQTINATSQAQSASALTNTQSVNLIQDVERLREQFPRTSDLYREVCALLFFRYDETPTAARLYQLVRRGSNSAPAGALADFWKGLREKSRVRISHPDVPPALQDAAGELVQTLWHAAQGEAKESLAHYVQEAQSEVLRAQEAERSANVERARVIELLEVSTVRAQESQERVASLESLLEVAQARVAALEAEVRSHAEVSAHHHAALARVQAEAAEERQRAAAAAELAETRFRDSEKRMFVEIDRERMQSATLARQLEAANKATAAANERRQTETLALQREIGDLRQATGKLEGSLQVMTAARDSALQQIDGLQGSLVDVRGRLTLADNLNVEKEKQIETAAAALEVSNAEVLDLRKQIGLLSEQLATTSSSHSKDQK